MYELNMNEFLMSANLFTLLLSYENKNLSLFVCVFFLWCCCGLTNKYFYLINFGKSSSYVTFLFFHRLRKNQKMKFLQLNILILVVSIAIESNYAKTIEFIQSSSYVNNNGVIEKNSMESFSDNLTSESKNRIHNLNTRLGSSKEFFPLSRGFNSISNLYWNGKSNCK